MPRRPNPTSDPVSVTKRRGGFQVRYYPTGTITNGNDRKFLPGMFDTRAEAEAEAALLRAKLIEFRNAQLPPSSLAATPLHVALERYWSDMDKKAQAGDMPGGSYLKRRSDTSLYVASLAIDISTKVGALTDGLAASILNSIAEARRKDNERKAGSVRALFSATSRASS